MTRNIMHGRGGLDFNTWFDKQPATRDLRSAADPLNVKKRWMEIRTNFYSIRVADLWNQVPTEVKALETAGKFKVRYKQLRRQR